jgi:glucosyl-dolichyl phosphate glucuronosyltransferase
MRRLAIVVPTFNRAATLERTLRSLSHTGSAGGGHRRNTDATQIGRGPAIIVVDNNSVDDTAMVAESFGPPVRYIREARQGLSFARNTGIAAARALDAEFIAFVDDDVEVAEDWATRLLDAFDAHSEAHCIGGRVLPSNWTELPAWLTRDHWGPLALQDHGEHATLFDVTNPRGLVGANFAFRSDVFDWVGEFSPAVQRVRDGIGSTEDHEMLQRLYAAGGCALYVPDLVVTTHVPRERMTYEYHRRWHLGHGRFTARMRDPQTEQTTRGRVLGVPAHLFRSAASDAVRWVQLSAVNNRARAFEAETRLWFFSGFVKERCACALRR